jgi:hypothetical protein
MTSGRAQRENRGRDQRSESKSQARPKCNDSRNADAKTRESHFGLKRNVFPADKFCCRITEENMENEVDEIAYANGESM